MKHETSELKGALLDAAVSKAEGYPFKVTYNEQWQKTLVMALGPDGQGWHPAEHWGHGGPLIDRERPAFRLGHGEIVADIMNEHGTFVGFGETFLIAFCRALVASRLGDEVDLG